MPSGARHDRLDALRGLALVWMTVYHFCFDLNHFGLIRQNFYEDPRWTLQRTAIVSLFLFTAGFGQVLAVQAGQGWPRFWRRWGQVAGCAVLVSLGSWWMFPGSWISFGVLHGLAVMLLLARAGTLSGVRAMTYTAPNPASAETRKVVAATTDADMPRAALLPVCIRSLSKSLHPPRAFRATARPIDR
mgnify:CR=1 FL=1